MAPPGEAKMRSHGRASTLAAALVLGTGSAPARAASTGHDAAGHLIAGLRLVDQVVTGQEEQDHRLAPGAFVELPLVEHLVDLEVSAAWLRPGASLEGAFVPGLLIKLPVKLDEVFTAYGGAGGHASLTEAHAGGMGTELGALFAVGAYAWDGAGWGLNLEVDYAAGLGGAPSEIEVLSGVVCRL